MQKGTNMQKYKAVLFDMDGTVLNTVDDLTASINYAMQQCGHRHDFTSRDGCRMFGSGVHTAITRALAMEAGITDDDALRRIGTPGQDAMPFIRESEIARIEDIYRPWYLAHSMDRTAPYDGVTDLLRALRTQGYRTAVVSNKPDPAVKKLARECFAGLFDAAIGEQDGIRRKPAPDMMDLTLRQLGITREKALYVGDSEVDIQTAQNTGMDCAAVSWGFRDREFLQSMHPVLLADTPQDLLAFLS